MATVITIQIEGESQEKGVVRIGAKENFNMLKTIYGSGLRKVTVQSITPENAVLLAKGLSYEAYGDEYLRPDVDESIGKMMPIERDSKDIMHG